MSTDEKYTETATATARVNVAPVPNGKLRIAFAGKQKMKNGFLRNMWLLIHPSTPDKNHPHTRENTRREKQMARDAAKRADRAQAALFKPLIDRTRELLSERGIDTSCTCLQGAEPAFDCPIHRPMQAEAV